MNMRNILKGNQPSRDTDEGDAWAEVWDKIQQHAKHPVTVIYGHDARRVPPRYLWKLIIRASN